jgi:hypothetical protein
MICSTAESAIYSIFRQKTHQAKLLEETTCIESQESSREDHRGSWETFYPIKICVQRLVWIVFVVLDFGQHVQQRKIVNPSKLAVPLTLCNIICKLHWG